QAGVLKDGRVDDDDVGHGGEGGRAAEHLGAQGGAALAQTEEPLKEPNRPSLRRWRILAHGSPPNQPRPLQRRLLYWENTALRASDPLLPPPSPTPLPCRIQPEKFPDSDEVAQESGPVWPITMVRVE